MHFYVKSKFVLIYCHLNIFYTTLLSETLIFNLYTYRGKMNRYTKINEFSTTVDKYNIFIFLSLDLSYKFFIV